MVTMMKKRFENSFFYAVLLLVAVSLSQCAKERKREDMTLAELSDHAAKAAAKKKGDDVIAYLEEIIGRFPDCDKISDYKMKLADQYFKDGQYPAAQELYEHFNQFYPADKLAEHAKYQSVLSMFKQTLRRDCDQSETEDTIKLCEDYLKNDTYKQYRADVTRIQSTCENKLIDKEAYVFDFYVKHSNYDAARNRLKHLKEKFSGTTVALNSRFLYLECKLARKEKDMTTLNKKLEFLVAKYPDSPYTLMAQALVSKNPFVF